MKRCFPLVVTVSLICGFRALAASPSTQPSRPFLLHLPGIAGKCWLDSALLSGLRQGGLAADTEIFDWTCKDPGLDSLLARARNQDQAAKIAEHLTTYIRSHLATKIYLTSHSGGGGVAVWALEKLPRDVQIDTLFLIAPALSPTYDLSAALRHVRGRCYVFSSEGDAAVLGVGTRLFGTIDGEKSDAAGRVGFTRPVTADPAQYAKIVPKPDQSAWMQFNNIGDHIGPMMTPFAKSVIAPLLIGQPPLPATQP